MKMEKNTISEQLKILIQTYGPEVLSDSGKINGILADLFPKAEKERGAIRSALKAGAGRMFYELSAAAPANQAVMLGNIRKKLTEEAWLSDQACNYVCTVFLRALGLPEMPENNKETVRDEKRIVEPEGAAAADDKKAAEKTVEKVSEKKSPLKKVILGVIVIGGLFGALYAAGVFPDFGESQLKQGLEDGSYGSETLFVDGTEGNNGIQGSAAQYVSDVLTRIQSNTAQGYDWENAEQKETYADYIELQEQMGDFSGEIKRVVMDENGLLTAEASYAAAEEAGKTVLVSCMWDYYNTEVQWEIVDESEADARLQPGGDLDGMYAWTTAYEKCWEALKENGEKLGENQGTENIWLTATADEAGNALNGFNLQFRNNYTEDPVGWEQMTVGEDITDNDGTVMGTREEFIAESKVSLTVGILNSKLFNVSYGLSLYLSGREFRQLSWNFGPDVTMTTMEEEGMSREEIASLQEEMEQVIPFPENVCFGELESAVLPVLGVGNDALEWITSAPEKKEKYTGALPYRVWICGNQVYEMYYVKNVLNEESGNYSETFDVTRYSTDSGECNLNLDFNRIWEENPVFDRIYWSISTD